MAKRMKAKKGRGAEGVSVEAEAILKRLADDSHLRDAVRKLLDTAHEAVPAPKAKTKKRRFGVGKVLLVGVVAGGSALAASEKLRTKVLDLMFGAEEEFEYSPPSPPSPDGEAATTPLSAV
jgi:hypothetical protein